MMSFGVAQSVYFITYNLFFQRFYMALPFIVTGTLSAILYYFARYNAARAQRLQLVGAIAVDDPFFFIT